MKVLVLELNAPFTTEQLEINGKYANNPEGFLESIYNRGFFQSPRNKGAFVPATAIRLANVKFVETTKGLVNVATV